VEAIGRLYPGRSKVVGDVLASKNDVKAWASDYSLLHLSVHGRFDAGNPLLSFLSFRSTPTDDGHLTAAEMFGLPLPQNAFVVLSACETGRVQATHSNEVLGMVRGLLYAGASGVVLSLWEVQSEATALWMENFYREAQTRTPTEAARLALVAVKARPEYQHPYFWGAFIMTGR
jgi:CHAT domain-containing protein